ncbi:MAG: hypothetical protein EA398_13800 [Deltaproteobacteria bacterium]|nr:MAG: hypothetical protein EA398_13800 [Deltaproteobacteria bacterium]
MTNEPSERPQDEAASPEGAAARAPRPAPPVAAAPWPRGLVVVVAIGVILFVLSIRMSAFQGAGEGDLEEAHRMLCEAPEDPVLLDDARAAARRAVRARSSDAYRLFVFQVTDAARHGTAPDGEHGAEAATDGERLEGLLVQHLREGRWADGRGALVDPAHRGAMAEPRQEMWLRLLTKLEWLAAVECSPGEGAVPP